MPPIAILVVLVAVGVAGFMVVEHRSLLEATYLVTVTVFTIGFDEIHPVTSAGRILTMIIALGGAGTVLYAAGQTMEIIVEGEMFGYRKRRQMDKRILEMSNHYIICGFGRVGHQVGEDFKAFGITYVVIDSKPETATELETRGVPHLIGDATSDEILEEAGIRRARGLVACSDSDVANVYVTLSARALSPRLFIVARASQRETEKKLKMAGANRVISPYFISGRRMAALATKPVVSDFLDLVTHGGELEFRLHEIPLAQESPLIGRTIEQTEIRTKSGALVLAIHKADGSFDMQPRAASMLHKGDVLVVIGTDNQIESLESMAG